MIVTLAMLIELVDDANDGYAPLRPRGNVNVRLTPGSITWRSVGMRGDEGVGRRGSVSSARVGSDAAEAEDNGLRRSPSARVGGNGMGPNKPQVEGVGAAL